MSSGWLKPIQAGAIFVLLALASPYAVWGSCDGDLTQNASPVSEAAELGLSGATVYAEGQGLPGTPLHLTLEEYRRRALAESIDPDTILLLDEIDLELDMPLVAGIIVKKPLSVKGTHIQLLAQKMGVPLIYSSGVDFDSVFFKREGRFALSTSPSPRIQNAAFLPVREIRKAVLPRLLPEGTDYPVEAYGDTYEAQVPELIGDKYIPLRDLRREFMSNVPPLSVLTSQAYLNFIAPISGFIKDTLARIENASEDQVREGLSQIREVILRQPLDEKFNCLYAVTARKSIRSNNGIEDLLGAGLYSSSSGSDQEGVREAIRKVYASLYTYRAYKIRRAWGVREDNLTMPVLIHNYIEAGTTGYNANLTARWGAGGMVEVEINAVQGDTFATNPAPGAVTHHLTWANGKFTGEVTAPEDLQESVRGLMSLIGGRLVKDLTLRKISPKAIDLEVVFQREVSLSLKPWILQYKSIFNREIVISLLTGELDIDDLQKYVELPSRPGPADFERVVHAVNARPLKDIPEVKGYSELRYALVRNGGRYEIVTWRGILHRNFKEQLRQVYPDLKWIRSGYIRLHGNTLTFSETTQDEVDEQSFTAGLVQLFTLKNSFMQALDRAQAGNSPFGNFLSQQKPMIEFKPRVGLRYTYE